MNLIDLIDNAVTTARVRGGAQREAARFARSVRAGRTYWSVVDLNCHYPGAPAQALHEWVFKKERITGYMRCGAVEAAQAWLTYGPLHERRPGNPDELMTFAELSRRPDIFERAALEKALKRARPVPAGV